MSERTVSEQSCKARLIRHPTSARSPVIRIEVRAARVWSAAWFLDLEWQMSGDLASIAMPDPVAGRREGLWKTTCLEAFYAVGDSQAYGEFNLSPTQGWASYAFDGYRQGMKNADEPVLIQRERHEDCLTASARLKLDLANVGRSHLQPIKVGFAAVIEDQSGGLSYWALTHLSDSPDFHNPNTFTLALPLPEPS